LVTLEVCSMTFMQSLPAETPDEACALVNLWVLSTFREPILSIKYLLVVLARSKPIGSGGKIV
jgi:hypothetical protein